MKTELKTLLIENPQFQRCFESVLNRTLGVNSKTEKIIPALFCVQYKRKTFYICLIDGKFDARNNLFATLVGHATLDALDVESFWGFDNKKDEMIILEIKNLNKKKEGYYRTFCRFFEALDNYSKIVFVFDPATQKLQLANEALNVCGTVLIEDLRENPAGEKSTH